MSAAPPARSVPSNWYAAVTAVVISLCGACRALAPGGVGGIGEEVPEEVALSSAAGRDLNCLSLLGP